MSIARWLNDPNLPMKVIQAIMAQIQTTDPLEAVAYAVENPDEVAHLREQLGV